MKRMRSPQSETLDVFVITSGEDVIADCEAALRSQELKPGLSVRLRRIENVVPMSEAFNEMHRRSESRFFLQVDADLILAPNAVQSLYDAMVGAWPWVYVTYGQLYEEGFGPGGSVRLWKKSFFRFFQFRDRRTVDRDLYKRARWFGFRRKAVGKILGVHRPRHSVQSEFFKTKADVEKWRFLGRRAGLYAQPLLLELLKDPVAHRFRLLGALAGALSPDESVRLSKNLAHERAVLGELLSELGFRSLEEITVSAGIPASANELFAKAYSGDADAQLSLRAEMNRLFKKMSRTSGDTV